MSVLNKISYEIIGAAFKVHSELGPGLLESTYEVCLEYEILNKGLNVKRQQALPVKYDQIKLNAGYRIDLIVENQVIVEVKSVESICPIHEAQLLTYLKLSEVRLGLLINFNELDLKNGIIRRVM